MTRNKNASTTLCTLPTLGDNPADGLGSPSLGRPGRRRRLSRKTLVAAVAGLLALSGATAALAGGASFNDTAGTPFQADIEWMATQGIAQGFTDGGYHPTAPVSRQAMASFMHKYNENIEVVTQSLHFSNTVVTARSANCPAGKQVIAGGGTTDSPEMYLTESYPPGSDRWFVRFRNPAGGPVTGTGTIYAVCVPDN